MARGVTLHPRIARGLRNLLVPRLLGLPRVRDAVAGSFAGTGHCDTTMGVERTGSSVPAPPKPHCGHGKLTHLQRSGGFVLIREREARPVGAPGLVGRSDPMPGRPFWSGPMATSVGGDSVRTEKAG